MSCGADKLGDGRTVGRTDEQTDAGNDNTWRPKLASGKKGIDEYDLETQSQLQT